LLDLNLPKMDGREVLAHIKEDDSLKTIPTVILTTSEAEADIVKSYQLQANCYLTKPVQLDAFESLVKSINDFWLTKVKLPQQEAKRMSKKSIKVLLLVEDNPGDARLLREMFNEQGSHNTELTHVECMSDAEKYLAAARLTLSCSTWGCPMHKDWKRCGGPTQPRPASPGGADGPGRRVAGRASLARRRARLSHQRPNRARGLLRALRYAVERKIMEEALFVEKERAQVTLNSIGDAVVCTDISREISPSSISSRKK
jgi:CheY-like chemotaxis protein